MFISSNVTSGLSSDPGGHQGVAVTYLGPCTEGPVLVIAFLMALLMILAGYWVILKWVAKVGTTLLY